MPQIDLGALLARVVATVEAEGGHLYAESRRPGGPRGERRKAPIDDEMEHRLRAALQGLVGCRFVGEETGTTPGTLEDWHWLVDPHDGTSDFLKGIAGSSISVALLRGTEPVLAVVHSPFSPRGGRDTIAWAEGCGAVSLNGAPLAPSLADRALGAGERVWATASARGRRAFFDARVAPAALETMPSIAHRLARVAAGEGVAAITIHPVCEYDIAAGAALVRAAGGVVLDFEGHEIAFSTTGTETRSGCFAGAPAAARELAARDWTDPAHD